MSIVRYMVVGVLSAFLALAGAQAVASLTPSASATWPTSCGRISPCVNNHLNNLDSRLRAQHAKIVNLQAAVAILNSKFPAPCYFPVGVREYGEDGTTAPADQPAFLDLTRNFSQKDQYDFLASC